MKSLKPLEVIEQALLIMNGYQGDDESGYTDLAYRRIVRQLRELLDTPLDTTPDPGLLDMFVPFQQGSISIRELRAQCYCQSALITTQAGEIMRLGEDLAAARQRIKDLEQKNNELTQQLATAAQVNRRKTDLRCRSEVEPDSLRQTISDLKEGIARLKEADEEYDEAFDALIEEV